MKKFNACEELQRLRGRFLQLSGNDHNFLSAEHFNIKKVVRTGSREHDEVLIALLFLMSPDKVSHTSLFTPWLVVNLMFIVMSLNNAANSSHSGVAVVSERSWIYEAVNS